MRLALDTNRYRHLVEGVDEVVRRLEEAETIWVPFVVLAELRAGFLVGHRREKNERMLERFLNKPGVGLLFPEGTTTRVYASLYRQLRVQGTPIPTNDLWIASLVVEHGLTLYTRDRHFEQLPQIPLL